MEARNDLNAKLKSARPEQPCPDCGALFLRTPPGLWNVLIHPDPLCAWFADIQARTKRGTHCIECGAFKRKADHLTAYHLCIDHDPGAQKALQAEVRKQQDEWILRRQIVEELRNPERAVRRREAELRRARDAAEQKAAQEAKQNAEREADALALRNHRAAWEAEEAAHQAEIQRILGHAIIEGE